MAGNSQSKKNKLNRKQELFCIEYVKTLNATQAYKAVYSTKSKPIAQSTAEVNGCKLLKDTRVKQRIDELMDEIKSEKIASAEEVLETLTAILRGEVDERFQEDLNLHHIMKASELLGKRHKLFTDKIETDMNLDIEINLTGLDEEEE